MEWRGLEWSGVERIGVEWSGVGWYVCMDGFKWLVGWLVGQLKIGAGWIDG